MLLVGFCRLLCSRQMRGKISEHQRKNNVTMANKEQPLVIVESLTKGGDTDAQQAYQMGKRYILLWTLWEVQFD